MQLAVDQFPAGALDALARTSRAEHAAGGVGARGRHLHHREPADHVRVEVQRDAGDLEVLERSGRLHAVVGVGGHRLLPEQVVFDAGGLVGHRVKPPSRGNAGGGRPGWRRRRHAHLWLGWKGRNSASGRGGARPRRSRVFQRFRRRLRRGVGSAWRCETPKYQRASGAEGGRGARLATEGICCWRGSPAWTRRLCCSRAMRQPGAPAAAFQAHHADESRPELVALTPDERTSLDPTLLARGVYGHLLFTLGRLPEVATEHDWYRALALAVRDRLQHRWASTSRAYARPGVKVACYLSAEFLLGPAPRQQPAQPRHHGSRARGDGLAGAGPRHPAGA